MIQRNKITYSLSLLITCCWAFAVSAEEPKPTSDTSDPVYLLTKQDSPERKMSGTATAPVAMASPAGRSPHPLDPALDMAKSALVNSQAEIDGYTAIVVKQERIGSTLGEEQYMLAKIRNEKRENGEVKTPFAVYLKFLRPSSIKGREVIYIDGENNGKLIAHEGGFKGRFTPSLYLDPNGTLAMMGQRYPITEIGIERLCEKLLERGDRDRLSGWVCDVKTQPATINKRPATQIEVKHPVKKTGLDFHIARIYVDEEFGFPVRYEAYDWPAKKGEEVTVDELIESYTYVNIKLNPGLTEIDFDPANTKYKMK